MSRWKSYAGIRAYVGAMGSGKTYLMTRDAVRALRQGREVWANAGYKVTDPETGRSTRTYVALSEMLLAPPGTLLLLDEVGTFLNARRWAEFPRALGYRLTQARKDSLSLTYTAQHELQVDVALRRLTAIVYHVRRIGPLVTAGGFPPVDYRKPDDRGLDRKWAWISKTVMGAYDTHARTWVPPEVVEELAAESTSWVPLSDDVLAELRSRVLDRDDVDASTIAGPLVTVPAVLDVPTAAGNGNGNGHRRPAAPTTGSQNGASHSNGHRRRTTVGEKTKTQNREPAPTPNRGPRRRRSRPEHTDDNGAHA